MISKPKRVKIIDQDTGHLIREGYARDESIEPSILFGLFTKKDIIKNMIGLLGLTFSAGILYANLMTLENSFKDFKQIYWAGHKELIDSITKTQERQDSRIDCLSGNLKGNCKDCQVC